MWGACALGAGCGRSAEDKIRGWPRAAPLSAPKAAPAVGPGAASGGDAASTGATVAADGAATPPEEPAATPDACRQLVDKACAYLGVYSEECIEARGRVPTDPTPETLSECDEIVEVFALTHERGEESDRVSPCRTLARRLCNDVGKNTETCEESRGAIRRLRSPDQRRACKGDLLLWDARHVLEN